MPRMGVIVRMLSVDSDCGRVTIGQDPMAVIRDLSDSRKLRCPACDGPVVLKAGRLVASHFAHLAGAACAHPDSEPETDVHRAGKTLIAEWLRAEIPDEVVTLESQIAESGQRVDVLVGTGRGRIAVEYQCADLASRDWLRRHRSYRAVGIRDLWLLGPSRLHFTEGGIHCGDLEAAMVRHGAPLLYFDPHGEALAAGSLARFRPSARNVRRIGAGRLSQKPLRSLPFPWRMLDWPLAAAKSAVPVIRRISRISVFASNETILEGDAKLAQWLLERYGVQRDGMSPLFGIHTHCEEVFACSPELWRAVVYCRFISGRTGEPWNLGEVETWARRYLPLSLDNPLLLRRALRAYQDILAAAELISVVEDAGAGRVEADITTLEKSLDPVAVENLAAYRRALIWEKR